MRGITPTLGLIWGTGGGDLGVPASGARAFQLVQGNLDLKVNGVDHLSAVIDGRGIWPGQTVEGKLALSLDIGALERPLDLFDLDLDFGLRDAQGPPGFADLLIITALQYGGDDLLVDPGRNLTREIDGNPLVGNGDRLLSLSEMQAGANDLTAPGPPSGPTDLHVAVTLLPKTSNEHQGSRVVLDMVFFASDSLHEDLN
jgi:hypothetical protein